MAAQRAIAQKKMPKAGRTFPLWVLISLTLVLGVLSYGLLRRSTPSAFDTAAAQMGPQASQPWNPPSTFGSGQ